MIRSHVAYQRCKLLLKRISGRELWICRDIKLRTNGNGEWCYAPELLPADATVYSFGVGDCIAFESELICRHDVTVHAFDPTPYALHWIETQRLPKQLKFHAWGVSAVDGTLTLYLRKNKAGRRSKTMWTADPEQADPTQSLNVPTLSIPSIMKSLGSKKIDLVKLDVEGAEYAALSTMLRMRVLPTQLLVEFHHRFPGIGKQKTLKCIQELRNAGYRIFHVSPTGIEIGFVLESAVSFT